MAFPHVELLNSAYARVVHENNKFSIFEKNPDGEGTCYFEAEHPVLLIRAKDQAPVVWSLENRRCAEGAFVVKRSESEFELHIVEMKSKLTHGGFLKVIEQWRGMYLSALATLGVIRLEFPVRTTVYVAYKDETVSEPSSAQLVLSKVQVGGKLMAGIIEWNSGKVALHHGVTAHIVKGQRNEGDVDFGRI
ncbi:hypothetical protein LP085_30925 [Achromobacter sp. MY14]|uniref:hypothetical protein n=1 Tax=unclassified Achromobacter TaxID=2626865 RepID=UPI001E4761DF|nr:hypothetical protein [Achromobacter sp. MY14]MCD0501295.1 hypothetical protein [Achromobacter sp. MY14]